MVKTFITTILISVFFFSSAATNSAAGHMMSYGTMFPQTTESCDIIQSGCLILSTLFIRNESSLNPGAAFQGPGD